MLAVSNEKLYQAFTKIMGVFVPFCEMGQIPPFGDGFDDGGVIEGGVNDFACFSIWGNDDGGDADTEAVEGEALFTGEGVGVGWNGRWWGDMIITAAMLIIGNNQHRFSPIFAMPNRLIDTIEK